jgi:hypothetical protein
LLYDLRRNIFDIDLTRVKFEQLRHDSHQAQPDTAPGGGCFKSIIASMLDEPSTQGPPMRGAR